MKHSFLEWANQKKCINENQDPFITLQQKKGDMVYFGVHDLAKFYRENGFLPSLDLQDIMPKIAQVIDADPVNQTVSVYSQKDPFHFGYKKLETKQDRAKRKTNGEEGAKITLPVGHLQSISHMVGPNKGQNLWLVIDGNTQYQQNLMREIRKKEIERAAAFQQSAMAPQAPQMPFGSPQQPLDQSSQFVMQHRNVYPSQPQQSPEDEHEFNLDVASFDPSFMSKSRGWKMFNETRRYQSYSK